MEVADVNDPRTAKGPSRDSDLQTMDGPQRYGRCIHCTGERVDHSPALNCPGETSQWASTKFTPFTAHDPVEYPNVPDVTKCNLCDEVWPCEERRKQRQEHKRVIAWLNESLFEIVPLLDTDPGGKRMDGPLGWSVWWNYGERSLVGAMRHHGEPFRSTTIFDVDWLEEFLP